MKSDLKLKKFSYPGYRLIDPRGSAAQAPYTFFLPTQAELDLLSDGDRAKLMFEHIPGGELFDVERMWVAVESVEGSSFHGRLASRPQEPTATIDISEPVEFERHHVIAIEWEYPLRVPDQPSRREYWERCLVDECVLNGTEEVEYIYRELPSMHQTGNKYPDSGWRIRGRHGEASDEEIAERRFRYVTLGAVLNRDDSWLYLIDEPFGTEFIRDFDMDLYRPVRSEGDEASG